MMKCDPRAFEQCPTHQYCGSCAADAGFMEGSECDKFNQSVLTKPKTNADRIRAMSDEELAKVLNAFTAYFEECNRSEYEIGCKDCELYKLCTLFEGKALEWLKQPAEE